MKCTHCFFILLICVYPITFAFSMASGQTVFISERKFLMRNDYGNNTNARITIPHFSGEAKPCAPNLLLTILMTLAKLRLGLHTQQQR